MATGRPAPSIWMRPERAAVGRPAQHSRAEITAAALAIADREGLDAVSMRRVAAELGTGAASLYRYVETRDELLDLMTDAVGGDYDLAPPSGDWLADLVAFGEQSREILRRHPWLPGLVMKRPVLGPNGLTQLEYVLTALARHPADIRTKLEAFAMLNGVTAAFAQHELAGGSQLQQRNVAYLQQALAAGEHSRLAELLSAGPAAAGATANGATANGAAATAPEPAGPVDRYADIVGRILTGLLGPDGQSPAGGR